MAVPEPPLAGRGEGRARGSCTSCSPPGRWPPLPCRSGGQGSALRGPLPRLEEISHLHFGTTRVHLSPCSELDVSPPAPVLKPSLLQVVGPVGDAGSRGWDHCLLTRGLHWGFPGGSEGKAPTCNAGDPGSIPGSGRSPRGGHGNPLQYSCLENPMDGGAWRATAHGVTKRRIRLSDLTSLLSSSSVRGPGESRLSAAPGQTSALSPRHPTGPTLSSALPAPQLGKETHAA